MPTIASQPVNTEIFDTALGMHGIHVFAAAAADKADPDSRKRLIK